MNTRLRFWWSRTKWRARWLWCWCWGHDAQMGECYRCGLLIDEDQAE